MNDDLITKDEERQLEGLVDKSEITRWWTAGNELCIELNGGSVLSLKLGGYSAESCLIVEVR